MSKNTVALVSEFVAALNALPDANLGFPARKLYDVAATYGITCREVTTNFLGKSKALTRGRYTAIAPDNFVMSRKEKTLKVPKVTKAAKVEQTVEPVVI